jgi:hypothetical protein
MYIWISEANSAVAYCEDLNKASKRCTYHKKPCRQLRRGCHMVKVVNSRIMIVTYLSRNRYSVALVLNNVFIQQ